jgi:betaine-aldehyde dehydrogenase
MDDFMSELEGAVKSITVGDPLSESTQMGPLISADQLHTVSSYVNGDAPVAIRGSVPDGPGYWFPPTVLAPSPNDARPAARRSSGRSPA